MLRVLAVTLALLLMSCATAMQGTGWSPSVVDFEGEALEFLDRIHEEFEAEIVFCLYGRAAVDTLYVSAVDLTRIIDYTKKKVVFTSCTKRKHVGYVHNHPSGACMFSEGDDSLFARRPPRIAMVSCGDGWFAWRTADARGAARLVRR